MYRFKGGETDPQTVKRMSRFIGADLFINDWRSAAEKERNTKRVVN